MSVATNGSETIKSIIRWFEIAKPEPNNQDLLKQISFHYEEFAEMCEALGLHDHSHTVRKWQADLMVTASIPGQADKTINGINRLALLDACADQVVTATGIATYAGMDFGPALAEVNRSNYTKFTKDEKGNPVPYIRPDGKIGKNPETYQEPELEQFIDCKTGKAVTELIMTLSDLQKTYDLPDFKGLLTLAKEKGFTDYYLANCIRFLFKVHETHILRSLSSTIKYQQIVINTLVDTENKDKFIAYINQCIEHGIEPHNLSITNWEEFFGEKND